MNSYDSIVIGGGLAGLLLTHRLHKSGKRVALFEARDFLGGSFRHQSESQPFAAQGLDFYAATNENLDILEWTKSISPMPLNFETEEHRPQVYDEGRWRPFAGFGDVQFQSISELSMFSSSYEISLEPGVDQLVRMLVEQLPVEALVRHEVTGFKVTDGRVSEVIVNGEKSFTANEFIFTPHPTVLNNMLDGEALASKHRSRLAKMQPWTAVILDLDRTPALVEDPAIRIFLHSAKEFEPVVGRVEGSRSKWMTLVSGDREGDHEFIGQCIRHIKRQLKRAWPEAFDNQPQEKIFIRANAFGQQPLKTKDGVRFPELPNLFLGNHILASLPGELGSLEMARTIEGLLCAGGVPARQTDQIDAPDF